VNRLSTKSEQNALVAVQAKGLSPHGYDNVGVPAKLLSSARTASSAASLLLAFITTFPTPPFPPRPLSVRRLAADVAPPA
jgi:hypothetical protein